MYMQQPSEYTEYGTTETEYADYAAEGGWNEYKRNGKPSRHSKHAGRRHDVEASNLGAALEAERADIVRAMSALTMFTGAGRVVRAHVAATV
jgi:hypothetical protein